MLPKDVSIIDATLGLNTTNYSKIARSHYYFEIYAGSLEEYVGVYNSTGQYPAMIKVFPFAMTENTQIGQAKTLAIHIPLSYYEYNYVNATRTTIAGAPVTAHTIGKGYLVKAYFGYASTIIPENSSVLQRFMGVVNDIVPNAESDELVINCVDFSTIFMNALNYGYPDINSYRDAAADSERVQPDNLYNDQLLGLYVPAYDNWLLKDAIRDICIKAKFPVLAQWLSISFNDSATMRLGHATSYPFMKSKTIFDYVTSDTTVANMVPGRPIPSFVTDPSVPAQTSRIEKTIYQGIDSEKLDEAKYKFDYGKSLWDCLIVLCEEFGLRMFFSETGCLTIKGCRQYAWVGGNNDFSDVEAKENHVWGWKYWILSDQVGCDSVPSISALTNARVIKGRFISLATKTEACEVNVQVYKDGNWKVVATNVAVPELSPYQYAEVELYSALNSDTTTYLGDYLWAVAMDPNDHTTCYFNGFSYLNTDEETVSGTFNASLDMRTDNVIDNSSEIRNSVIVLGKPASQRPLLSKSADNYSIHGGASIVTCVINNLDTLTHANSSLMDGKYTKYQTLVTSQTNKVIIGNYEILADIRTLILYLSGNTPLGTVITVSGVSDGAVITAVATHTVVQSDLTNAGLVLRLEPIGGSILYSLKKLYINAKLADNTPYDLSVCQIEGFTADIPYNYIGYKKEMLIVKDNVSDKATNDWMSASELDTHRKNARQAGASILGNPYIQIGDCLTLIDVENDMYAETELWVQGVASTETPIAYDTKLSLSSVPPAKTYTKPPEIPSGLYPPGIYDWSMDVFKKSDNSLVQSYSGFTNTGVINSIKHYCVFNFAIPVKRKVAMKVRYPKGITGSRNEIYAWPIEETIMEPGVYKRENGLKWDCGINFEERFGALVDKLYLYPTNSKTNYVYNNTFDIWFRQGQFNWLASPDGTPLNLTTPSYYQVEVTTRKISLVNITSAQGASDLETTYTQSLVNSGLDVDTYEMQWGDLTPDEGHVGDLLTVPLDLLINDVVQDVNDKVYLDCCAQDNTGKDVNALRADGATSNTPRWITTPALVQFINWDYTDTQGQYVPSGKYQLQIKNAFLINGEVVNITKSAGKNVVNNGGLWIEETPTKIPNPDYGKPFVLDSWINNSGIVVKGWTPVTKPFYMNNLQATQLNLLTSWANVYGMTMSRPAEQIVRLDYTYAPTGGALDNKSFLELVLTKDAKTTPGVKVGASFVKYSTDITINSSNGKPDAPRTPFLIYSNDTIPVKASTEYCFAAYLKSTELVNLWNPKFAIATQKTNGVWRLAMNSGITYTPGAGWERHITTFTTEADDARMYPIIYMGGFNEDVYASTVYDRSYLPTLGIDCISVSIGSTPAVVFNRDDASNARTTRNFLFN